MLSQLYSGRTQDATSSSFATVPLPKIQFASNAQLSDLPKQNLSTPLSRLEPEYDPTFPTSEVKIPTRTNAISSRIAQLVQKPYVSLRGVHIVVHSLFGPKLDPKQFSIDKPFEYAQQSFTSQWTKSKSFFEHNSPNVQYQRRFADRNLSQWYHKSRDLFIKNFGADFSSLCFTLDVDDMFYGTPTETRSDKTLQEKEGQNLLYANARSFDLFREVLLKYFEEGVDYDIVEESGTFSGILFEETSKRRYSIFIRDGVLEDVEKMSKIVSYNGFLNSVYYFLMNKFSEYDCFVGNYTDFCKHYFVEVIGFASPEDWQNSAHDFSFYDSRLATWNRWVRRDDLQQEVIVSGIYTTQMRHVAPFASFDWQDSLDSYYAFNRRAEKPGSHIFNLLVPLSKKRSDTMIGYTNNFLLYDEAALEISGKKREHIASDMDFLLNNTHLPVFTTQNALNPFDHEHFFHRDEFDWQAFEELGSGAFGHVLKVRWQFSHSELAETYSTGRRHLLKHHVMILQILSKQKQLVELIRHYKNLGLNDVVKELSSFEKPIDRLAIQATDGTVVDYDFVDDNDIEAYNESIRYILIASILDGHSIVQEWIVDSNIMSTEELQSLLERQGNYEAQAYTVDIRLKLALKMSEIDIVSRTEAMIVRILTTPERYREFYFEPRLQAMVQDETTAPSYDRVVRDVTIDFDATSIKAGDYFHLDISPRVAFPNTATINMDKLSGKNINFCYGSFYDQHLFFSVQPHQPLGSLFSIFQKTNEILQAKPIKWQGGSMSSLASLLKQKEQRQEVSVSKKVIRPLSLYEFVSVLRDCAHALSYTNSCGVCHGDFKWANILLNESRQAFLTDFGSAKSYGSFTHGMLGSPSSLPPDFMPQTKIVREFSSSGPFIDTFAFGRFIAPLEKTGQKVMIDNTYLNANVARFVGCRFNDTMIFNNMDFEMVASDLTLSTRDEKILFSQCPLSLSVAEKVVSDLNLIVDMTTYKLSGDDNILELIRREILKEPDSTKRVAIESREFNRLTVAQAILDYDLELIRQDVTLQWKDIVVI